MSKAKVKVSEDTIEVLLKVTICTGKRSCPAGTKVKLATRMAESLIKQGNATKVK